uniref:Uncharacterized protein n=1 Tax=Oryza rufipogon TaxID=4529 RepID=A0A0E0PII8_ORYRU
MDRHVTRVFDRTCRNHKASTESKGCAWGEVIGQGAWAKPNDDNRRVRHQAHYPVKSSLWAEAIKQSKRPSPK